MANNKSNNFPRICIIGAGFSGLCTAYQLQAQLGIASFTILERNDDVGGTWLTNTYPGLECDTMGHWYSYSFYPNPCWNSLYPSQKELLEYLRRFAATHNLKPKIQFGTEVRALNWDDGLWKWRVTFTTRGRGKQEMLYDIVIMGCGQLQTPNFPKEFLPFEGRIMHTAEWDEEIQLKGKTVAVVGSGASAIQVIPAMAPEVRQLHVFHTQPAWIIPKLLSSPIPNVVKSLFGAMPFLLWVFRLLIFVCFDFLGFIYAKDSPWNRRVMRLIARFRNGSLLNRPDLIPKLIPNYAFGCKRPLQSNDYYPALMRPNVTVTDSPITEVGRNWIRTKEEIFENIDVLVLATGYKTQVWFHPMEIIGKDGVDLLALWRNDRPSHYYGVMTSVAPNLFMLVGPNTFSGITSLVFLIECEAQFIVSVVKELLARKANLVRVKLNAEKEYMRGITEKLSTTVWGGTQCGSWHENPRGEITTLLPYNGTWYWSQTRKLDVKHFEFLQRDSLE